MINGTFDRIPLSPKWQAYLEKAAERARQAVLNATERSRRGWATRRENLKAQKEKAETHDK